MEELNRLDDSIKPALEALLLVSADPVPAAAFAKILEVTPGDVFEALSDLAVEYQESNRGFQLREVAGGWRLFTHPAYHEQVEAYVLSWDTRRLSQAALETLAVIAYHQPTTREGVKAIRGVNSEGVISSLIEKGLVKELGRERGQAIMYGTTQTFLEHFGLKSLKDLPDLEQFAPDEQSKAFIRERLSGRSINSTLELDEDTEDSLDDTYNSSDNFDDIDETVDIGDLSESFDDQEDGDVSFVIDIDLDSFDLE